METSDTESRRSGRQAAAALAMTVPAPTLGLLAALYAWPDSAGGQLAYGLFKLWLIALPVLWLVVVDKRRPQIPRPSRRGMAAGIGTGAAIFGVILGAYALFGHWIDADSMARQIGVVGLGAPGIYIAGALYWCTVNSILEEYVWRWFVFTRCEALMPKAVAVIAAGLFFTFHHGIALAFYFDWRVTALATTGVFIGGTTWSWLYLRWRNIYAAWASHAVADIAVFGIGWHLVFANGAA